MKPSTSFFVVALFLTQLGTARWARAQATSDETSSSEAQAHQHFNLGVKLHAEGDLAPALAQFQRAYALKPHFRVLYNIAQCNFELRDYVQARAALRRYLAEGGAAALDAERRARVEADLADMGRRIAEVEIHSNVQGAVVYVDGRRMGTTPLSQAIEVSEGQRSLAIESSAGGTKQRTIVLVGGEHQTITVNFELKAPGAGPSSSLQESRVGSLLPSSTSSLGASFWVAGVGAALFAGGAGVTGYLALRAQKERSLALSRPGVSAVELDSDRRRIQIFATTSDALLASAIVCAGVATTLVVVHGTATRPALAVGPGHAELRGSF